MTEELKYYENISEKELFIPPEAATIDKEKIEELKQLINNDQELQKNIIQDNEEIDITKRHWERYCEKEWGNKKRISLSDFLKLHKIVEQNKIYEKKVWNKKWTESLRWSNEEEKQFLEAAKDIGQGKFVEVLQISSMHNGQITNKDAIVGSGKEIQQKNIDGILNKLDIVSNLPETIYVIHNHFDEYSQVTIPENEKAEKGFATNGGLSKQDIEFADELWSKKINKKTHVIMIVINERGLTFTYEAGTSEKINQNDN